MKGSTENKVKRATKAQLTEALVSACNELAGQMCGFDMYFDEKNGYVSAGSLNNQVLRHLTCPDMIVEG